MLYFSESVELKYTGVEKDKMSNFQSTDGRGDVVHAGKWWAKSKVTYKIKPKVSGEHKSCRGETHSATSSGKKKLKEMKEDGDVPVPT